MLKLELDMSDLFSLSNLTGTEAKRMMREASEEMATFTHAQLVDMASNRLKSSADYFISNLEFRQENEDTWLIVLPEHARWVDDGLRPHEMIDDLVRPNPRNPSKKIHTDKQGNKSVVIPIQHNKQPSRSTTAQADLAKTIKAHMNKEFGSGSYGKIEKTADGQAKLGLLNSFSITNSPTKTSERGPGQGFGPVGAVKQGLSGTPFLQNVRVYQKMVKNNKTGKMEAKKFVMTFRIASTKQKGSGMWYHPGLPPRQFMEEAYQMALDEWENHVSKALAAKLVGEGG